MTDAFSRVSAFFLGAVLLFIVPASMIMQRSENAISYRILSETTQLVDSVCCTGVLTKQQYYQFEQRLFTIDSRLAVSMVHKERILHANEEEIERAERIIGENEIKQLLEEKGSYRFSQNDYFRIEVTKGKKGNKNGERKFFFFGAAEEEKVVAYYGGRIRYETD